ncbi:uncharacterized protein LOC143022166 isoform X2 [Oratosquilla oratoria]|uniref:uncharacterized protein LOC143022166 isoform X2 n=1 Tax=Oratosquilla oratoria TaxID=337810 RepID=UPI003F762244
MKITFLTFHGVASTGHGAVRRPISLCCLFSTMEFPSCTLANRFFSATKGGTLIKGTKKFIDRNNILCREIINRYWFGMVLQDILYMRESSPCCPLSNLNISSIWRCNPKGLTFGFLTDPNTQQHGTSRTRMRSQHSKKVDCPAAIHIAHIVKFPEFKVPDAYLLINSEPTEHTRKKIKKQLVDSYRDSAAGVALDVQFFVRLPDACAHHGHPVLSQSPKSKTKEPVDPKILELIHDLTQQGVTNIKVFQEHIASYVNNEVFKDEEPPPLMWRRYNPTEHDIRNAMYKVRRSMVKEKKRHLQNRCTSLLHDITQMVLDNDDEVYLEQLEEQLKNIHMSVQRALPPKEEEPHKHLVKKKCSESSGTHVCIKQEQSQEEHPEPEELTLTTYELTFDPSEPPQLETETEEVVTEVYYYEDPPLEYDFESVITES